MFKHSSKLLPLAAIALSVACSSESDHKEKLSSAMYQKTDLTAPIAKKVAEEMTIHDDTRVDQYYWMNQRDSDDVINYLNEENAYTKEMFSHLEDYQEELFEEIKGRFKQNDMSVPYDYNGYTYQTRYEEGKDRLG